MKHISKAFFSFSLITSLAFASTAVASTTISSDISTGGNLTVSGTSILTGIITAGANITIPASYGFDVASAGTLNIGTTTATAITIASTNVLSTFRGPVKITGAASTTGDFSVGGNATTTASNGNIATNGSLTLANSSTAIAGIVFGFCNIANSANITASSSAYFNCTGATGVTSSHRVFVQATSSMSANLIIVAASSTPTAGTINLQIYNTGNTGGTVAPGAISVNFFGIR
ncbi:hypothetical protein KW799_02820 [Candidatus Parcubacteria bacterium]|nr:hypothetical protein [Candidatus Parcubacteria bacterium]